MLPAPYPDEPADSLKQRPNYGVPDDRFERLANLMTFLLDTERAVTYAEIMAVIPGYPEGQESRRRAFERDKRLLRDEDVPLVEDNGRYRIPPGEYYLPDLDLTEDEQLALELAVAAVPIGGGQGGAALQKLMLGGIGSDRGVMAATELAGLDEHPLLPMLHAAIRRRATVTFTYSGIARTVEPAMLFFRERHWYLRGFDRFRDADRTFLISHIEGEIEAGVPRGFEPRASRSDRPTPTMPRENWLIGHDEPELATVWVDAVLASKASADAGPSATMERRPDGSVTITMPVVQRDAFRSWVLGLLDHVQITGPPELRQSMVEWLRNMAQAG